MIKWKPYLIPEIKILSKAADDIASTTENTLVC
jgi:hypothetical protein